MTKQKIIRSTSSVDFVNEINEALRFGWLVHTITANSETGVWIAVMQMEAK